MSDIVERLRQPWPPSNSEDPLMSEAAARIEKLEASLREARAFIDGDSPDWRKLKQMQLAQIDEALGDRT